MLVFVAGLFANVAVQAAPASAPDRIIVTASPSPTGEASVVVAPEPAVTDIAAAGAVTVIRIRLRRDGDFKDCAVAASSGFSALDDKACDIARRVHTLPPVDKPSGGKVYVRRPYKGQRDFQQNVVWRIEN